MLAKLTSKNQLTLPKAAVEAAGSPGYFQIEVRAGQLVLTPIRLQRADAVRAKLAQLNLGDNDLAAAVAWARSAVERRQVRVAEHPAAYRPGDHGANAKRPPGSGGVAKTAQVVAKVGKSTKSTKAGKAGKAGKAKAKAKPTVGRSAKPVRKRPG